METSLNPLVKKLEIGKDGLQGMVYSFHKLEGLPHKVVDDAAYLQCEDSRQSLPTCPLEKHMSESA